MPEPSPAGLRARRFTLPARLGDGVLATSPVGYRAARKSIRHAIVNTGLPLTSDNVARAGRALYWAKASGRNRVCVEPGGPADA